MAEELCPVCGCVVADDAYEEEGVMYCCEPCATGGECVCGCCEITEEEEE